MARLLLSLAYDGTAYAGWQRQQNGVSIQACVEDALAPLAGAPVTVNGAGRTDAGVHAEGQMAHVDLPDTLTPDVVLRAANARLPRDIRVRAAWTVADTLHARHSATSKTYRYRWLVSRIGHPLLGRTASLADPPLDVAVMHEACRCLMGTHDFAAFRSAGSPVLSTTRTVSAARVTVQRGPLVGIELDEGEALVEFEITGDGFLRHMVRALAGTLELVGHGRHPASWMAQVLASGDRSAAGATAAAHGLTLVRVTYRVE